MNTIPEIIAYIEQHPNATLTLLAREGDKTLVLSTARYAGDEVEAFHGVLVSDTL